MAYDLREQDLISLAENDLIEYEQGIMTYRTTEKGLHILKLYNEMNKIARLSVIPTDNQNNDLFI
ncbi:MAG TPA: winged helix-turn-helix domain-containing protein [Nitrososphaeraceae archaeon]|nr:winged helix-turn-helix domain-containing protein [Nitrososphaeraceae archaeon]